MLQYVIRAYVYNQPAARVICDRLSVEMLSLELHPRTSEYVGTFTAPSMPQPLTFQECTAHAEIPLISAAQSYLKYGSALNPLELSAASLIPSLHLPDHIHNIEITDAAGTKSACLLDSNSPYGRGA